MKTTHVSEYIMVQFSKPKPDTGKAHLEMHYDHCKGTLPVRYCREMATRGDYSPCNIELTGQAGLKLKAHHIDLIKGVLLQAHDGGKTLTIARKKLGDFYTSSAKIPDDSGAILMREDDEAVIRNMLIQQKYDVSRMVKTCKTKGVAAGLF